MIRLLVALVSVAFLCACGDVTLVEIEEGAVEGVERGAVQKNTSVEAGTVKTGGVDAGVEAGVEGSVQGPCERGHDNPDDSSEQDQPADEVQAEGDEPQEVIPA